ncbi:MAG: MFS transporter [Luteolibacter sp.]|jgi:MFS family permease|nr:MFS transporter [Luteolibacter sp.]
MIFGVLWIAFFLQGMTPGLWLPALTNILGARGLDAWVPAVFVVSPVCALISPLIGGALADQRMAAERLFAWSSLLSAVALFAAFAVLDADWNPAWFVSLLGLYSLFAGPQWGVLATVSLTHLSHGERQFPLVRVGATIGWVVGGLMTSFVLRADTSPLAGYASAIVRLLAGLVAFYLPHTPPLGVRGTSLKARLGFGAFSMLRQSDHCVFFVVTALFSIPLSAFYMYGPEFLKVLGDAHPAGTMTLAQVLEVGSMLLMGLVMTRFRVKIVLSWALGLSVLRFAMSAWAGTSGLIGWHIAGIALHGMCYTFYFITAQVFLDRRVDPGLKGQAQGLLAMVSGGLGPLIGALVCGWMRQYYVTPDGNGWDWFWGVLAAMIAVCFALFVVLYRGRGKRTRQPATGMDSAR